MNELQNFTHEIFGTLPVIMINGIESFGATEAAKSLSFGNPYDAIKNHVDLDDLADHEVIDRLGRKQNKKFVNESGLYSLIIGAAKQGNNKEIQSKAKLFKRWVTNEILPSIRQTGGYIPINEADSDQDILAKAVLIAKKTIEKKDTIIANQNKKLEEQRPKVVYAEAVTVSEDTVLVKDLAIILKQNGLDIGSTRLFDWLRDNGYLCKKKGDMWNMPTQKSLDLGVIVIKHGVRAGSDGEMRKTRTPKITGKGQIYFVNKIISEKKKGESA